MIQAVLERYLEEGWMPAAAWHVRDATGEVQEAAVGFTDSSKQIAASPITVWDLASLTKPLCTATIALLSTAQGKLDLDEPWTQWMPEFRRTAFEVCTPAEVLSHRARFSAWAPLYRHGRAPLESIAALPPIPDEQTELYSDLGYIALGIFLSRVWSKPLDLIFSEQVTGPLKIPGLGFARLPRKEAAPTEQGRGYEQRLMGDQTQTNRDEAPVIQGTVHDGNAAWLGGVAGHAGLFGTVAEVAVLFGEWLRPNVLAWGSVAERRFRAELKHWSLGLLSAEGCQAASGLPSHCWGHLGFTGTSIFGDPKTGASAVLLTNRVHPQVQDRGFEAPRQAFHRAAATLWDSSVIDKRGVD